MQTEREWLHDGFVVKSQLIATRHWTQKLIDHYLPKPCKLVRNWNNTEQTMSLYALPKVIAVEATPDFQLQYLEQNKDTINNASYNNIRKALTQTINKRNKERRIAHKQRQKGKSRETTPAPELSAHDEAFIDELRSSTDSRETRVD